jgi:hypothetical protein
MADAVGYWTLPNMLAGDVIAWLGTHTSDGMKVESGGANPQVNNASVASGAVVDVPSLGSVEAVIFTVTSIGYGSGIRIDAFTIAANSVCATPPPGTELGIGG